MQPNNSIGENDEVSAANSSHNYKNASPESTKSKNVTHIKDELCQNPTEYKYAEAKTDNSAVRIGCNDNDYFEEKTFGELNSVGSGETQRVYGEYDIKQLKGLAKRGRVPWENNSQVEAHNREHHLYSATVTDMELTDCSNVQHIDCKEDSLLGTKRKKNVDTTEKSLNFAAESDMELTKVFDVYGCEEEFNTTKDKKKSVNSTEIKTNLIYSNCGQVTENSTDRNSIKNICQQLNATKRFSTNNGLDITDGYGRIDCISGNEIPNDSMSDMVNSSISPLSRLSMDEDDCDRNEEKTNNYLTKYCNTSEVPEKSFINENMEETVAGGCLLLERSMDLRESVTGFKINETVGHKFEYSDNILPSSGVAATATKHATENKLTVCPSDEIVDSGKLDFTQSAGDIHIEKCTETSPDNTNNFNTCKTILMCVDMETTQNTSQNDQDDSFMQFTKVVEANIQDNSMQDSLVSLEKEHSNHTEHFNIEEKATSATEKSEVQYDMYTTQTKPPLCDKSSVFEIVVIEEQTDVCVMQKSSDTDAQNDYVNSQIADTQPNHPLILKLSGKESNIEKDVFTDATVSVLSENNKYESYCKERLCEGTGNNSTMQTEHFQDGSVKSNSTCLDVASKIEIVLPTSSELQTGIIQQVKQANDVDNSLCRVPSDSSVIGDTIAFCVAPISDPENIPSSKVNPNKILSEYSVCQPHCSDKSELHCLPAQTMENCFVTGIESQCGSRNRMFNKKRRSSEIEETIEIPNSPKKQCISTDHINVEQRSQDTVEDSGLAMETKSLYDREAIAAIQVDSAVMNIAVSERAALLGDTHSGQAIITNTTLLGKTAVSNISLPRPSDQNIEQNFMYNAKPVVLNNQSDSDLELLGCETMSASMMTADCQNKTNDAYVIEKSNATKQKDNTRDSEEVINTAGTPRNISVVDVAHTSFRKDKNPQDIDYSVVLQIKDDDKNTLLSANGDSGGTNVTIRRGSRYENNTVPVSFMQKSIKKGEYCTEINQNKYKSKVTSSSELNKDIKGEKKLDCSFSKAKLKEKTAEFSRSRCDENNTSAKEGDGQIAEGMKIHNTLENEISFHEAGAAIHIADKTFHSWYLNKRASIMNNSAAPSANKINSSNSCQKTFGTPKSSPADIPDLANSSVRVECLAGKSVEIGQNVTHQSSPMDFRMSDEYLNTEIQVPRLKEKVTVVDVHSTSNYLSRNREQDSFSKSCLLNTCDSVSLNQSVQENKNSNAGKEVVSQQFSDSNSVERPNADVVDVLNGTSETNDSQEHKEKHVRNLMEVSLPGASYGNTPSLPAPQSQHTTSVDRAQELPPEGLRARDSAAAAFNSPVSSLVKCVKVCSQSVRTARGLTSTAESPKIKMTTNGVEDTNFVSVVTSSSQNSKCGCFHGEIAVHSETLHSTVMKVDNIKNKQEVTVVGVQEEKQTLSVKNKSKKIKNLIISKAESSQVLWNIKILTQFQWIFTFLNDTLRLYINFDKSAEDGIIEDLALSSYLTGKADDDAKFVHFVLLKKFSNKKLKGLCKNIEEVADLLEKISVDVRRMVTFLYEFQKVQALYNMEMFDRSVTFSIRSYKLTIFFKLTIDLSNWEQILENNITLTQIYGHVNEAEVKQLAKAVKTDAYFLQNYFKAVQQYMKILERFGC